MGLLRNISIVVLIISLVTFVALFGQLPALRKTPIGWLQRLLCIRLPNGLKRIDTALTGGEITFRSQRLGHYLFYEKNPVVLVAFLVLLTGSAAMFLWHTLHQFPTRLVLPIPILLALPYIFTYLCVSGKAHFITASNLNARMSDYPYDHVIYRPRTGCKTCKRIKPARSKHCSLCGFCVAKCDHHCPWINNCLGRGNYRYFLALLLSLSIVQFYGAYLSWWILSPYLTISHTSSYFSLERLNDVGHAFVVAVNKGGISIAGVGLLAASTAFLPLGLFLYHCYLIWAGMTTNESQKWSDWREEMELGSVFQAKRSEMQAHNEARKASRAEAGKHDPALNVFDEDDVQIEWPIVNNQVLVVTRDGQPPYGQETLWRRVWSLNEVENIYDLGGLRNLVEILQGR